MNTYHYRNDRLLHSYEPRYRADTNKMLVNGYTMYSLRIYYRRMRQAGLSRYMARMVLWNTLFDAMINKPTFIAYTEPTWGTAVACQNTWSAS